MTAVRSAFRCQRCGACGRWPGAGRLFTADVERLAAALGLDTDAFAEHFCWLGPNRVHLVLAERTDGTCVVLDGVECRVDVARPIQGRGFPMHGWREGCLAAPALPPTGPPHVQRTCLLCAPCLRFGCAAGTIPRA